MKRRARIVRFLNRQSVLVALQYRRAGERAGLERFRPMSDVLMVSSDAQEELRTLIHGDDKGRKFVRIFIQGWG